MAQYMALVIIALPFVLVFAVVYCGYVMGGLVVLLGSGFGFLFGTLLPGVLAAAFVPMAFAAGYMIREKKRFRDGVAITAFSALAGCALAIAIVWLVSGKGIVDFSVDWFGAQLKSLSDQEVKTYYGIMRSVDLVMGAVTQKALDATPPAQAIVYMQKMLYAELNLALVYYLLLYSMLAGYLVYIITRIAAKRRGMKVARIPAFADYTLPKRFWVAAILSSVFAVIGADFGWAGFDILKPTIYNVYAFVLMAQGLCVLDYMMRMQKASKGVRVVLGVVSVLLLGTILLPMIGLIENAIGIRKRIQPRKAV